MGTMTPKDRLQPCLLDRLTDDDPGSKQEGREQCIVSYRKYRAGVLRDLLWLLNTTSHVSDGLLDGFADASRSVLNFGIPELCGLVSSGIDTKELADRVSQAIRVFEPRIIGGTLGVRVLVAPEPTDMNPISFEIKGEL